MQVDLSLVETGNFRNDLVTLFKTAYQGMMAHPPLGDLVLKFIGEYQTNPEIFQVFLTQLLIPRFQQFSHMVEQAQARGEIRRDIDWTLVIDLLTGPLYYHWIITRVVVPSSSSSPVEWIEQMIDAVIQGIGMK